MDKLEKVEKVREKCGVSYEEAREALEHSNYDVLDAIIYLEQQGKTQTRSAHHTTAASEPTISEEMAIAQQNFEQSSKKTKAQTVLAKLVDLLKRLCTRGLEVSFIIEHNGAQVVAMPVLILLLLILFLFPATIPLLIVGLFFGFRYHFEGLKSSSIDINAAMDKAAQGAESFRHDVMDGK